MDRKEFLETLGLGAAAVVCASCLDGCNPLDPLVNPPANVDFTLDLTAPQNSALNTAGGFIYQDNIIIANTTTGYVAVSSICTHEGGTVAFQLVNNRFHCTKQPQPPHGSNFTTSGAVINGLAPKPLKMYTTTLNGNLLRVQS